MPTETVNIGNGPVEITFRVTNLQDGTTNTTQATHGETIREKLARTVAGGANGYKVYSSATGAAVSLDAFASDHPDVTISKELKAGGA